MESELFPLTPTASDRITDTSVCGVPLDRESLDVCDTESRAGYGGVLPISPLKRRSLVAEMDLHLKRPAVCDSSSGMLKGGSFVSDDISQDYNCVNSSTTVSSGLNPGSDMIDQHLYLPHSSEFDMSNDGEYRDSGHSNPVTSRDRTASSILLHAQMPPVEQMDICVNRQIDYDGHLQEGECDTSICVDQSSIGTMKSGCTTQNTSRERSECDNNSPMLSYNPSSPRLPPRDMQGLSMMPYDSDMPADDNMLPSQHMESINISDPHVGFEHIDSYPVRGDFAGMSQMESSVSMAHLENTAILDTMLGPTRSADASVSNMLRSSLDLRGQSDTVGSLEIRRLSNASVNLASDCSDLKRQIVVDENLTNNILKDLICSICLDYFYHPVTLFCGHTFCRYCIGHFRLASKFCPLCRREVGRIPAVTTILWNLVKSLKIRKRSVIPPAPRDVMLEEEHLWWQENCLKHFMSLPLFLRIMFRDIVQSPPFFDDVCSCVADYFDRNDKWSKTKWLFTVEDAHVLRRLIGFDSDNMEYTATRLHLWIEDYLSNNPNLSSYSDDPIPYVIRVQADITHKIEPILFNAFEILNRLPWDVGRHNKSLIHLPHSSVSLSHLVFLPCGQGGIGITDCGSTIGTMIKIQGQHTLRDGDRIHIGDKHELDIILSNDTSMSPYGNFMWDPEHRVVVDVTSLESTEWDASTLEPIECPLRIRIYADSQDERDLWVSPKGVILGRGPQTQSNFEKISVTTQNGYISREHCLLCYDGSYNPGERWILRDMSTLGTFLKLKPFQPPYKIQVGSLFKVGQCKLELCDASSALSRRGQHSPATLILSHLIHNHFSTMSAPMVTAPPEGTNIVQSSNEQSEV
ncbi:FHA domain family protein [Babesia bovis T2Bo]|uniref:E3 ubiquitin-protein ligase CHFR n=1 Tax=Babesia bovis TaxID=5865 RepID=A7AVG7_BABBO|nr:FHA domain family protein [Babesia bovis T2Bo]EDO05793.1 FHA domain family protein [Babesia bovis T2Bo]|eukprot:XP_001609361.1 zinc finger protein [Babesia bovis T2Bo]